MKTRRACLECGKELPMGSRLQWCHDPCLAPSELRYGRITRPVQCGNCGKEFIRSHPSQGYCTPACQHEAKLVAKRVAERPCVTCGTVFHPLTNQRYCEDCKPPTRRADVYGEHKGDRCDSCGFVPEHRCQLDIHHEDGDRYNNDPANLRTLCANCHRLVSLRQRRERAQAKREAQRPLFELRKEAA